MFLQSSRDDHLLRVSFSVVLPKYSLYKVRLQKNALNMPLPYILLVLILAFSSSLTYAVPTNSKTSFIDFNLYPYLSDIDSDSSATLNISSSLPSSLSYFSLTNFGNQTEASELEDIEGSIANKIFAGRFKGSLQLI